MGIKNGQSQTGCILADEMGLGKVEDSPFVSLISCIYIHPMTQWTVSLTADASNHRDHIYAPEYRPNGEEGGD